MGFGFPAHRVLHNGLYQAKYTRGDTVSGGATSLSVRDVVGRNYESYELARQHLVARGRSSGRRPQNSNRSAYNIKRTDSMRAARGKESMRQLTEALDAKLG